MRKDGNFMHKKCRKAYPRAKEMEKIQPVGERVVGKTKQKSLACEKKYLKGDEFKFMASAKSIKESLIKQLENKGADVDHFLSLVDDYIWYFEEEKAMQKDIKIRGHSYKTKSSSGYPISKENPSVKNALMYNKQKLAILKQLGLTIENTVSDIDDEL